MAPTAPEAVRHLDLVTNNPLFSLSPSAQHRLFSTGFVEVQKPTFDGFLTGYADLFEADLPVWVTVDSFAHPIHRSFEEAIGILEQERLAPDLIRWLDALRRAVANTARDGAVCDDLDVYLTVAASLAHGKQLPAKRAERTPLAWSLVERLTFGRGSETETFSLFDRERTDRPEYYVPRGHYLKEERLQYYYRAVTWLKRQALVLVGIDQNGPTLNPRELEAAAVVARAVRQAGLGTWSHGTLDRLVGRSGSLPPEAVLSALRGTPPDSELARRLLRARQSRLRGHALGSPAGPVVFSLAGERTSLDGDLFVHLPTNSEPVDPRDVPRTTDVGYAAFGNDSALALSSRKR
ncbi:MAG: DUF3160 domain-containing protein, partial [Polyangiaceae bacterium]|nr:DUF3160 domain-containing protein [Polyangiaceae bacterium]